MRNGYFERRGGALKRQKQSACQQTQTLMCRVHFAFRSEQVAFLRVFFVSRTHRHFNMNPFPHFAGQPMRARSLVNPSKQQQLQDVNNFVYDPRLLFLSFSSLQPV